MEMEAGDDTPFTADIPRHGDSSSGVFGIFLR